MMMKRLIFAFALLAVPSVCFANFSNIETDAKYAIILDYDTSAVIFAKNADEPMKPSSMTKLVTAYVVMSYLKKGIYTLDDKFTISENAAKKGGSKSFVKAGSKVTIEELLNGSITQSGNDATIALAEGIAGSEENFAALMNLMASTIGLKHSNFKNSTGWPHEGHYMSTSDIALLSLRLIEDFPEYYPLFSKQEYSFNNIKQYNRNLLLGRNIGVDGLKTGHTEEAGYGIAISGQKDGRRVIVVVNGLESKPARISEAQRLYDYAYRHFENKKIFAANSNVAQANVWFGNAATVTLQSSEDVVVTVPKLFSDKVRVFVDYNSPLPAPISKGEYTANLVLQVPGQDDKKIPLYAANDVKKLSGVKRFIRSVKYIFGVYDYVGAN